MLWEGGEKYLIKLSAQGNQAQPVNAKRGPRDLPVLSSRISPCVYSKRRWIIVYTWKKEKKSARAASGEKPAHPLRNLLAISLRQGPTSTSIPRVLHSSSSSS